MINVYELSEQIALEYETSTFEPIVQDGEMVEYIVHEMWNGKTIYSMWSEGNFLGFTGSIN